MMGGPDEVTAVLLRSVEGGIAGPSFRGGSHTVVTIPLAVRSLQGGHRPPLGTPIWVSVLLIGWC